jgi:hypothetical protein
MGGCKVGLAGQGVWLAGHHWARTLVAFARGFHGSGAFPR